MSKRVKRIPLSFEDIENIKSVQRKQVAHYKDKVVVKPWGYEFMFYSNEYVAIWLLHIKKGHSTSMHCHALKTTSLALLSGEAECNSLHLSGGDSLIIDAGAFHSTKALDDIFLVEIESPPNKLDLIRLDDKYGRRERGYEGSQEMVSENLDVFGYFYGGIENDRFSISFEEYPDKDEFKNSFVLDSDAVYGVCEGSLLGYGCEKTIPTGEIENGRYLRYLGDTGELGINRKTLLIKMKVLNANNL